MKTSAQIHSSESLEHIRTATARFQRHSRTAVLVSICVVLLSVMAETDDVAAQSPDAHPDEVAAQSGTAAATIVDLDLRALQIVDPGRIAPSVRSIAGGDSTVSEGSPDHLGGISDPLVGEQAVAANKSTTSFAVDLNTNGVGFSGATPADTVGAIGAEVFVQMVNGVSGSVFVVVDPSTGSIVSGPTALESLAQGSGNCAEGWGHPGVLYDSLAQRWVLSELGAGNHLCVYVSQTEDPVTGGWFAYDFELPRFPDFPRLGVWTSGYSVTTNEDLPTVYALERAAMLGGGSAGWQRFTVPALSAFGFQALTPVDFDGTELPDPSTGPLFIRQVDGQLHGGVDRLELFGLDVDWSTPSNSTLSGPLAIQMAGFDSTLCGQSARKCIPQPGTGVALDPNREIVSSLAHYRRFASHESLTGNFVVDTNGANKAGIRWFELRRSSGAWSLHQEGTFSPDNLHRWTGGIAMDRNGNLGLVFNSSGASVAFPSISATGREATDPVGIMTVVESEIRAGTSAQTVGHSPERWGSSTALSIDPHDDCTYWVTGTYTENGGWNTGIASFRFPSCAGAPSGLIFSDGFESGDLSSWSDAVP